MSGTGVGSELEGTWVAQDAKIAGEDVPQIHDQRLSFFGDRFNISKDGMLLYGGKFQVDYAAVPPSIDFDQSETKTLNGIWLGIYQVNGNQLTISDNSPDMTKPRPQYLISSTAASYLVVHFTRGKSL